MCIWCSFTYRADFNAALNIERAGTSGHDVRGMGAEDDYAAGHLAGGARLMNRQAWTGMDRYMAVYIWDDV